MVRKIKLSDIGGRYADEISEAFSHNDSLSESEAQIKLVNWCNRVKLGDEVLGEYLHHSPNLERDGKRLTGQVLEWDMDGKSTTGHSDLNMATIHKGVRVI